MDYFGNDPQLVQQHVSNQKPVVTTTEWVAPQQQYIQPPSMPPQYVQQLVEQPSITSNDIVKIILVILALFVFIFIFYVSIRANSLINSLEGRNVKL